MPLDDNRKQQMFNEFDELVSKWVMLPNIDRSVIEHAIACHWEHRQDDVRKSYQEWLSKYDFGPYGGR